MKKKIKKAFTLVELLVVIAILAILATVSIVGYNSFTKKAKVSNDTALVAQLNTLLKADEMVNGKANTPTDALKITSEAGYDVEKLTPTTNNYEIIWNQAINQFALLDENKNVVYGEKNEGNDEYKNWKFVSEYNSATNYSVYLKGTNITTVPTIHAGIDVGRNTGISSITYTNTTKPQDVRIVTNGNTSLEINGYVDSTKSNEGDVIEHYGSASNVNVVSCAMKSYHEFGQIDGNITLKSGHVSLENNSSVNSIVLDTTSIDTIAITQNDKATINGTVIALDENVKNSLANSSSINVKKDVIDLSSNVTLINTENAKNLKTYLDEEKYCLLSTDVTFDYSLPLQNKKVSLDLNNHTLTFYNMTLTNGSNFSIKNGTIVTTNKTLMSGSIVIEPGTKLEMSNVSYIAENSCGIFPKDKSELVLKNTNIKAAVYAVGTNAAEAQVNSPLINISAYNCVFTSETNDYDNTAVYINVPVVSYFENCRFNGGRQAAFVRGGTATFKDCNLSVSGKFSPMNKYYDSNWSTGNELPTSALTVGNRDTSTGYNYPTSVTLLNTKLEVLNNADTMYALYAYGLTKDNYTVTISYDSSSSLGRTNLENEIGNVTVNKL